MVREKAISESVADFVSLARKTKTPIVIYESEAIGQHLLRLCYDNHISVECFCDATPGNAGKRVSALDVLTPQAAAARCPEALFLISSVNIRVAVATLEEIGVRNWFPGGLLIDQKDCEQPPSVRAMDWEKYQYDMCRLSHAEYADGTLFLRSAEIIITEQCSLKCKDCSNLMQYYSDPKHCDMGLILRSFDAFFSVVDNVLEFRILGGEPFVNKEWPKVVQRAIEEPKIGRIVVITNATILPKNVDWHCLQDPKVRINMSDYGQFSPKLAALVQFAEDNGINYWIYKAGAWNDCAKVMHYQRTPEENRAVFKQCYSKNIWTTLSDGKLFRCPYAANLERLQGMPYFPEDYVNLLAENVTHEDLREQVSNYLLKKDVLSTCDYCSGVLTDRTVPPALQTRQPLPYKRFGVL